MTRNLLRLALVLTVVTFGLTLPRPAVSSTSCGSGDYFVPCTRTCCGPGVTTTYSRQGVGSSCGAAKTACAGCLPPCPAGQTLCGSTVGTCMF